MREKRDLTVLSTLPSPIMTSSLPESDYYGTYNDIIKTLNDTLADFSNRRDRKKLQISFVQRH